MDTGILGTTPAGVVVPALLVRGGASVLLVLLVLLLAVRLEGPSASRDAALRTVSRGALAAFVVVGLAAPWYRDVLGEDGVARALAMPCTATGPLVALAAVLATVGLGTLVLPDRLAGSPHAEASMREAARTLVRPIQELP